MILLRILVFALGVGLVVFTLRSAIRTFVLPRAVSDGLSRAVFLALRGIFDMRAKKAGSYLQQDGIMALYAPVALLSLPVVWLATVMVGYTAIFWALSIGSLDQSLRTSGSSLLTLGFAPLHTLPQALMAFSEAAIGLLLVALLIAYLPTMYSSWSRREHTVARLEIRAGSPPSVLEFVRRLHNLDLLDQVQDFWDQWDLWFTDVEESHTSLAALSFFRSPQSDRSWVTAAGAVLDSAAFFSSTLDIPRDLRAELCIRSGYIALRRIAALFRIEFNRDPQPDDPISISREEYDEVVEQLAELGVPLKPDRDQAWRDFAGWRVNYDTVLLALAMLTMAPYAPWTSDRSLRISQ